MLKLRFSIILVLFVYFIVFAIQNNTHVNLVLPFIKTFYNIPLFLVLIISLGIGATIQFLTSGFGKKKKKKKDK
jgi:uncharacterized integral membrane protein